VAKTNTANTFSAQTAALRPIPPVGGQLGRDGTTRDGIQGLRTSSGATRINRLSHQTGDIVSGGEIDEICPKSKKR
jgi:hypothetical protein